MSGAIISDIAERYAGLLPNDANGRARAITWMFSALNTMEPVIFERQSGARDERDKTWYKERLSIVNDRVRVRLDQLSIRLGDAFQNLSTVRKPRTAASLRILPGICPSGSVAPPPGWVMY